MWSKRQIYALKQEAFSFLEDDYIFEHYIALNAHFNRFVEEKCAVMQGRRWRAIETEAEFIAAKLALLDAEKFLSEESVDSDTFY